MTATLFYFVSSIPNSFLSMGDNAFGERSTIIFIKYVILSARFSGRDFTRLGASKATKSYRRKTY